MIKDRNKNGKNISSDHYVQKQILMNFVFQASTSEGYGLRPI